jgi:hypothetical protein
LCARCTGAAEAGGGVPASRSRERPVAAHAHHHRFVPSPSLGADYMLTPRARTCACHAAPPQGRSTALHEAARWGHTAILGALLLPSPGGAACALPSVDLGSVLDANRRTPLYFAASAGHRSAVEMLLGAAAGVEVGRRKQAADFINCAAACTGYTPLHAAADRDHAAVVRLLLDSGADAQLLCGAGQTARQLAEAKINRESLEQFVRLGRGVCVSD